MLFCFVKLFPIGCIGLKKQKSMYIVLMPSFKRSMYAYGYSPGSYGHNRIVIKTFPKMSSTFSKWTLNVLAVVASSGHCPMFVNWILCAALATLHVVVVK